MSDFDDFDSYFGANTFEFNDDYTNKTGVDLIQDPQAVSDVRNYYEAKGETFSSDKDLWDRFYKDRRWRDTNTISMGLGAAEYALAGDSQKLQARLSKMWSNAPSRGGIFEKVTDYGLAGVLDPINLVGGVGIAKKGTQVYRAGRAAMQTTAQATKAGVKAGAIQGAKTEAALNAGIGAGFDAGQQAAEIQQGVSDEFDPVRTAMSGALDATIGGVVGLGVGAFQGNKAIKQLRDWQRNSPLGQNITTRSARLETEIESVSADLDASTSAMEREDLTDHLTSLRTELNQLEGLGVNIDEMDARLDEMSSGFQAQAKTDPEGARQKFEADYQALLKQRDEMIDSADLDNIVDPTGAAPSPRQGPEQPDTPQPKAPEAEATGDTTPQSGDTSPTTTTKKTTTEVENEATGTKTTTTTEGPEAEVEAEVDVTPTPYKWGGKKVSQAQKLENDGKITVDEVGRLVTQGVLEVTDNGNIKQRYGKGDTAYSRVQGYISNRDAGVKTTDVDVGVADSAPPKIKDRPPLDAKTPSNNAPVDNTSPSDAGTAPADVDLDSQANEEFAKLYDIGMAAGADWSVMAP